MDKKSQAITIVITLIASVLIFLAGFSNTNFLGKNDAKEVYQIYLDGEKIGLINNDSELYSLINEEQSSIKSEYKVDQVYPPKGFSITKYYTYDDNVTPVAKIYDTIKEAKDFTVKGYTITVSSPETEEESAKTLYRINVLDKSIFEEAINQLIKSFISEEEYNNYINNTQIEINDTGSKILNIYFQENISIKETYISTEEKIFTNVDELSKYLLFGEDNKEEKYTVKAGDTIESIANENELNVSEFLVANSNFKDANDLLAVGDKVIISLISPKLTLIYDMYVVEDEPIKYETVTKYDYSKSSSYKAVETAGVNGIQRVAKNTQIINGDANQGAVIDKNNSYVLREPVTEVIVRGRKNSNVGTYVDDGTNWAWPTNYPYTISSGFGTRYLYNRSTHDGMDITGTGYGSPIYAISGGEVISAQYAGILGKAAGLNIVIKHPNGYYSNYAHLSAVYVKVGDIVSRKQKIGAMGNSGQVTGTHLHLGVSVGVPYQSGSYFINPMRLW